MEPSERGALVGGGPRGVPPLRVLHVVIALDVGGMERVLTRVAHELVPRGLDIWVCGLERRGVLADTFPNPGQVVSLDKPAGRSLGTVWRLHRLIRRVRPDVVHTHNLGPLIYAALATGYGRLVPILHGEHCQLLGTGLGAPRLRLRRLLYRACWRVHTVAEASRQELLGLRMPAERLVAVVNGVDTAVFSPGDRREARQLLGLPAEVPCVGVVARMERHKRHELVIRAVERLASQGWPGHLLLAGDGPLRSELEAIAQAGSVGNRIHFLGLRQDVRPVYLAADLMVLPSVGEGLSNAILEAMACGVPVLCHDACGCAEVIADGADGWVRHIDSAEALAGILGTLFHDRDALRTTGEAARRTVCDRFAFRRTVDGYERLYRDCVER